MRPRILVPWIRAAVLICGTGLAGCASLHHYATNKLGDALAGSGSGFSGDDDPELIRAAAPFSLKLMESLLQQSPQHTGLLTAAAGGFTQYAYAFVQEDADELQSIDLQAALAGRERALGLYARARDYGLRALETRHPGFGAALHGNAQATVMRLDAADSSAIYWTAAAWASWISLNKDSADALADLPLVGVMLARLQVLDPDFDHGALDSLLISYEMGLPGHRSARDEAQRHFERAVLLSQGHKAGPYVAFAESVSVARQDRREFVTNLQQALAVDMTAQPQWRLENRVMQRRARWLLSQVDQLFIE
jgi:predicted anti-sigma-YlaC factor YlaD